MKVGNRYGRLFLIAFALWLGVTPMVGRVVHLCRCEEKAPLGLTSEGLKSCCRVQSKPPLKGCCGAKTYPLRWQASTDSTCNSCCQLRRSPIPAPNAQIAEKIRVSFPQWLAFLPALPVPTIRLDTVRTLMPDERYSHSPPLLLLSTRAPPLL